MMYQYANILKSLCSWDCNLDYYTPLICCFISKCILNRMDVAILSNTSRLIFKMSSVDIINEIDCGMS